GLAFNAAAVLGRRQGVCRAQREPRESETSKRKSVRGFKNRSGKESPRRDPKFSGWWRPVRRKDQPHQATTPHFTEPHPASRMADPPSEWRPYAATQSGPLLSPLSENSRRIEASHDSTRLPRVKMAL